MLRVYGMINNIMSHFADILLGRRDTMDTEFVVTLVSRDVVGGMQLRRLNPYV